MYDVLIIGAGVIGCALAQRLGEYKGRVAVLDAHNDVSCGASKANSGIVHAGYDAKPGTEKARLNVKGAQMMPGLARRLGVPYGQPGALVLGFDQEDRKTLQALLESAQQNQVPDCRLIEREEILQLEPNLNPEVACALLVPSSGLVGPYELTHALADSAAENGVDFLLNKRVQRIEQRDGIWHIHSDQGSYQARAFINCAGTGAGELHNQVSTRQVKIIPRRGQYYLLDHTFPLAVTRTIFQVPTRMGKGVLVTPTTHGNLLLGPTAEDIPDGEDTATTAMGLEQVLEKSKKSFANANMRNVITTFSGIRAHEVGGDFIIGQVEGAPEGAFCAIGIESPGLSAAPAIGQELGDWVAYSLKMEKKPRPVMPTALPKAFSAMNEAERRQAYENDPDHGQVVCRCELVTEAEVRASIRKQVGARDLDGVKRRTRAGMGRCQGGFCATRVMEILSEELGIPMGQISKSGGSSQVLSGELYGEDQA